MGSSSDYFGDDDAAILEFIDNFPSEIPVGDSSVQPSNPRKRKRSHSNSPSPPDSPSERVDSSKVIEHKSSYTDAEAYNASKFGGWDDYMRRKRAKLQVQNSEIASQGLEGKPQIFKGLQIYINGFTDPPLQDLRKLITEHGGVFHAYLDRKSMVTHILSHELTPAKIKEFAKMKVVQPAWIVQSVEKQTLLRWQEFILIPGRTDRVDAAGSKGTHVQKSLLTFQTPLKAAPMSKMMELEEPAVFAQDFSSEDNTILSKHIQPNEGASTSTVEYPTDPATLKHAAHIPSYAAHDSNPSARRLMASSQWRAVHTSVADDFVEKYFKNSRLHHLSTWKEELKLLVRRVKEGGDVQAAEERTDEVSMRGADLHLRPTSLMKSSKSAKGMGMERANDEDRVIMHCDFDSFFVSAGLVGRPELKGKPVVVCHASNGEGAGESSTSEIASASYEARATGVKNGMSLGQARQLCPGVIPIPYEFERYKTFSLQFYNVLLAHADDIQVVSVDEALLDVSKRVAAARSHANNEGVGSEKDLARDVAEKIRDEVRAATGCEVSIGISHNILLARLATRAAKPAKSFHLLPSQVQDHISPLDIRDLPGVGWSIRDKIETKFNVKTCGEIRDQLSKDALKQLLGDVLGPKIWDSVRGIDHSPLGVEQKRKSVSAEVNYGIRFQTDEDAKSFIHNLAQEVGKRLDCDKLKGRSLTLKIMKRHPDAPQEAAKFLGHGICEAFNKSIAIGEPSGRATANRDIIREQAWKLLKGWGFDPKELRGIGIQIQKLEDDQIKPNDGQGVLRFKSVADAPKRKAQPPGVDAIEEARAGKNATTAIKSPSRDLFDLPSASQIDPDFLAALPSDIREELLVASKRVGNLGSGANSNAGPSNPPIKKTDASSKRRTPEISVTHASGSREASPDIIEIAAEQWKRAQSTSRHTSTVEPTTPSKEKPKSRTDVKHIAKQLAPKRSKPLSPSKSKLFSKREAPKVEVAEVELKELGIDPGFFRELPADIQRDQLSVARQMKREPSLQPLSKVDRTSRSRSRSISVVTAAAHFGPAPVIHAKWSNPPSLKKATATEDIQALISQWIDSSSGNGGPTLAAVESIKSFLLKCIDPDRADGEGDCGLEKVVSAMRWWRHLLRGRWGEAAEGDGEGRKWMGAFDDVKAQLDEVVKKRFGGRLSLD